MITPIYCRCPFLALSATIGNPDQVAGWLQDVKSLQRQQDQQAGVSRPADSYTVRLVQHSDRYADLRYHIYNQPSQAQEEPADAFEKVLRRLHPCAVLDAQQIQHTGFPPQVTLEPRDCLELFNSMRAVVNEHIDASGRAEFETAYEAQDQLKLDWLLKVMISAHHAAAAPLPLPQPPGTTCRRKL